MNNAVVRMTNLFRQLGLESSERAIAEFIRTHQLAQDVNITDAPYWNEGQRQFLAEQIKADAIWSIVVDQLSESLHEDSVRKPSGQS